MTNEIWKPVVGFEGMFLVSNRGRVKSVRQNKERLLTPFIDSGYYNISLWVKDRSIKKKLHRIIAEAFIPNPESKRCVNHKNSNPLNNEISNLEWCSHSENNHHAYSHGRKEAKGIDNGQSILTESDVKRIYQSNSSRKHLAMEYNVSYGCIRAIKTNRNWTHITRSLLSKAKEEMKQQSWNH